MTRRWSRRKSSNQLDLFIALILLGAVGTVSVPLLTNSFDFGMIALPLVGVIFILGGGLLLFIKTREDQFLRALKISDLDQMAGVDFEKYVAKLLNFQGYKTRLTPVSGDLGVDLVAEKGKDRVAVQLKRYHGMVDRTAVSDAVAGMKVYGASKAMVVTNSRFTPGAKVLANIDGVELVDRDKLLLWMVEFQKRKDSGLI